MRHILAALFVALVVAPALAAQDSTPAVTGPYTIRGSVRDSTDHPIESAVITVYGLGRSATTNWRGDFAIGSLPGETRVFEIVALGYKPRILPVAIDRQTTALHIAMSRTALTLDSVRTVATKAVPAVELTGRRQDRITATELEVPELSGRNALEALELLRPQLFRGRQTGVTSTPEPARRSQLYARDTLARSGRIVCAGIRACDVDKQLSVSIDEGPLGSPDILSTLSVSSIREMKYLMPIDAVGRFGVAAGGGPVLIVYTK